MAPVYVSFLEKQEEIRANREAPPDREHFANGWETADSNIDESAAQKKANQSNQTDEQQKITDKKKLPLQPLGFTDRRGKDQIQMECGSHKTFKTAGK